MEDYRNISRSGSLIEKIRSWMDLARKGQYDILNNEIKNNDLQLGKFRIAEGDNLVQISIDAIKDYLGNNIEDIHHPGSQRLNKIVPQLYVSARGFIILNCGTLHLDFAVSNIDSWPRVLYDISMHDLSTNIKTAINNRCYSGWSLSDNNIMDPLADNRSALVYLVFKMPAIEALNHLLKWDGFKTESVSNIADIITEDPDIFN